MKYTRVYLTTDEDGHKYIIPFELQTEFKDLVEEAYRYGNQKLFDRLEEKFSKYRVSSWHNNVELYVKTNTVFGGTFGTKIGCSIVQQYEDIVDRGILEIKKQICGNTGE